MTSGREVFTVWMKSLVMNSNGCTVFDSSGKIIYRVDNYDCKRSDKVYLMDLRGKVLVTILRKFLMKKFRLFKRWEGYRCTTSTLEKGKPWFQVRKPYRILKGESPYEVTVAWDKNEPICYKIERLPSKSSCKILDKEGEPVTEVKQKQSTAGVLLGDDVLKLVVEPHVDHSLIMGLVVVYSMINHKI